VPRAHPHTRHAPGRGARRLDPHPIFSGLAASCPEEGSPGRVTAEFPSCRIPAAPSQHPRPAAAIVATRLGMVPDAVVRHLHIRSITVRSQLLPACSPTCMPANAGAQSPNDGRRHACPCCSGTEISSKFQYPSGIYGFPFRLCTMSRNAWWTRVSALSSG